MKFEEAQPNTWNYPLENGWEALAGKTDTDNDLLSLRVAKRNDLWFHAKAVPGSHVVLRGPDGEKPGTDLIKLAASIAAWHSKSRTAGRVPVHYTQALHVSKRRGAKPGSVMIKREKTIMVRPALPTST